MCVIDVYSRECDPLFADTFRCRGRVGRKLDIAIMERLAKPIMVVSYDGTALTSTVILNWSQERKSKGTTRRLARRS